MKKLHRITLYIWYAFLHLIYKIFFPLKPIERLASKIQYPILYLKILGVELGKNVMIYPGIKLYNFEKNHLTIHNNVHIGEDCFFDLSGKITVEENVTISMRVTILTHLNVGESSLKESYPMKTSNIFIGKNSYIGANALILEQVKKIGEKSLIGAGSVVYRDTEPNALYTGVPAIKKKTIE